MLTSPNTLHTVYLPLCQGLDKFKQMLSILKGRRSIFFHGSDAVLFSFQVFSSFVSLIINLKDGLIKYSRQTRASRLRLHAERMPTQIW